MDTYDCNSGLERVAAMYDELDADSKALALLETLLIFQIGADDSLGGLDLIGGRAVEKLDNSIPRDIFQNAR